MGAPSVATPAVGVSVGGQFSLAPPLLSSRRLLLLARSLLLFPDVGMLVAWVVSLLKARRNQRHTSSVSPSVSSTSLAGTPFLLQLTHARNWLCVLGVGRGSEPALA